MKNQDLFLSPPEVLLDTFPVNLLYSDFYHLILVLFVLELHMNRSMYYDWLFSFDLMLLLVISVVAVLVVLYFFIAENYSTV